ncbi:MAG: hypothetical protein WAL80_01240 [Xanthobacteraceae bacterium]
MSAIQPEEAAKIDIRKPKAQNPTIGHASAGAATAKVLGLRSARPSSPRLGMLVSFDGPTL